MTRTHATFWAMLIWRIITGWGGGFCILALAILDIPSFYHRGRVSKMSVTSSCKIWDCILVISGFPPYLENHENLEFCYLLFQVWKMPGICWKIVKTWNFYSKLGKNLYFVNFVFHDSLFKMSFSKKFWFTSLSYLHYQHKDWFKAKLTWDFIAFTWNNLENTWNFVSPVNWEPCHWMKIEIRFEI